MKCSEARQRLLEQEFVDGELRNHLDQCPECAGAADIAVRLHDRGRALQAADLSDEAIQATRRRVAEVLATRDAAAAGPLAAWRQPRPLLAAAAAAMLIAGVAVLLFAPKHVPDHPTAAELAMQQEITELRYSLMDRLDEFRNKYRSGAGSSPFSSRSTRLQARLNVCFFELNRDLDRNRKPGPGHAGLPDDANQAINMLHPKERIRDEDTAQDEPQGTHGPGGPGNTVALADDAGTGAQI